MQSDETMPDDHGRLEAFAALCSREQKLIAELAEADRRVLRAEARADSLRERAAEIEHELAMVQDTLADDRASTAELHAWSS